MTDHERAVEAATKAWMDDRGIDDKFDHWRESIDIAIDAYLECRNSEAVGVLCTGCGSSWDDSRLAEERSKRLELISCCPERKMIPVFAAPALAPQAGDNAEEPVAWRWESAYGGEPLIGKWNVATVKPTRFSDATAFACEPLYTHPSTSTPVVSQNAPDLEDKGGDGWQPISTAPKDGTDIILGAGPQTFEGNPVPARVTVGHWTTEEECQVYAGDCGGECRCPEYDYVDPYWMSWDGGFTAENPATHWMPLPAAPALSSAPEATP